MTDFCDKLRLLRVESNAEPSLSFCMGSVKLNNSYSMNGEQQLVDGNPHAWPHRIHVGGRPSAKGIPADILFLPGMVGCVHSLEVISWTANWKETETNFFVGFFFFDD